MATKNPVFVVLLGLDACYWRYTQDEAKTASSQKRRKSKKWPEKKYHSIYLCVSASILTKEMDTATRV